jgi:hypothetical protein
MRTVGLGLAWLSIAAFGGILRILWRDIRERSELVAGFTLLLMVTGIPLGYARHSLGEIPSAFFVALFVSAWLGGRSVTVAVAALLATLTKETIPPLLVLLGLVCEMAASDPDATLQAIVGKVRKIVVWAAAGIALGMAVNIAFNVFRFGQVYNASYLEEATWGPGLAIQLRTFVALWVAPNGGLLFFFPLFIAAWVLLPSAIRRARAQGAKLSGAPAIVLLGVLLLLTGSLSGWWAAFGWYAWGQRLTLPILPATLLVLSYVYAKAYEPLLQRAVASAGRTVALVAGLALLGLPHAITIPRGTDIVDSTFHYGAYCGFPKQDPGFYRCVERLAWSDPSPLVRAYRELFHPSGWPIAVVYVAMLAAGTWYLRERAVMPRPPGREALVSPSCSTAEQSKTRPKSLVAMLRLARVLQAMMLSRARGQDTS